MPQTPSFKRERRLRSGHASTVWQYRDIRRSKVVAVKYLANKEDAKEEVKTLKRFWHPNVINFVDFFKCGDAFGIVMHGMDMDLRHFISTELYNSVTVCEIARQSAQGLHHVHALQTLHADIKAENIGLSMDGPRIHVRLLDFGSARLIADIKTGDIIRSTRSNQSPEKRLGMFHLPGDIYELGVVYQEVIDHSVDRIVSNELCGGLVQDMLRPEYALRPTSQQVLVRLGDPLLELWERLCSAASGHEEWKSDFDDLIRCEDPLTFLARDLSTRMEFIVKLLSSDSLRQIEKAFFLLFKTAQGGEPTMQYLHHFHGVVDTTWWTKLFYCMAVDALSALPNFCLTDIIKIKLWTFSGLNVCERYVRGVFLNCLDEDHLLWCSGHRWGAGRVDFASFVGERI